MSLIQFYATFLLFFVTTMTSTSLRYEYHYQTKYITKDVFIGEDIKNVNYLDFRGCSVERISSTAFDGMPILHTILLSNNMIGTLPDDVFKKLKNIDFIQLADNKLKHITSKVFSNLNKLKKIDLSFNSISSIEVGAFDNDVKLETIILNNNKLTIIPVGIFNNLLELVELNLGDNLIYNIEDSALPNTEKFTTLKIHVNKFQHLNKKIVESLSVALIDKNPWFCDCKLKEVHAKWETTFKSQGWIPVCEAPKHVHNIRWDNLATNDFVCPDISLQIYPEPFEITAEFGHRMSLNCYITGVTNASGVKWTYKNNKEVSDVLEDAGRFFTVQFNAVKKNKITVGVWYNITINEVINSDDGVYKCVVNIDNQIYEVEKRVLVGNMTDVYYLGN